MECDLQEAVVGVGMAMIGKWFDGSGCIESSKGCVGSRRVLSGLK